MAEQQNVTQWLVGYFVDQTRLIHGVDPPARITSIMSKSIRDAVKVKNFDVELIREAIEKTVRDGVSPSVFHEVLWQTQAAAKGVSREDRQRLREFMADHDGEWPTGARFVHGTHSGTYVFDPIGYDRLPRGYDHGGTIHTPTRVEVLEALRVETDSRT